MCGVSVLWSQGHVQPRGGCPVSLHLMWFACCLEAFELGTKGKLFDGGVSSGWQGGVGVGWPRTMHNGVPFVTAPYPLLDPLCLATLNTDIPFVGPLPVTLTTGSGGVSTGHFLSGKGRVREREKPYKLNCP
eukprot:195529-Chlamydomonas_euryale.AAC.3